MISKKALNDCIDQYPDLLLYKSEIKKSLTVLESGCYFKLPSANTDWCVDLFKVIHFLCYKWKNTFFVSSEPEHLTGCIYLYIDGRFLHQ